MKLFQLTGRRVGMDDQTFQPYIEYTVKVRLSVEAERDLIECAGGTKEYFEDTGKELFRTIAGWR